MALCDIILALGVSFGCESEPVIQTALPENDPSALSFTAPPKPEPEPEPTPPPVPFPNVVIQQVIKEVPIEVPVELEPEPEPPAPDPIEIALKSIRANQSFKQPSALQEQAVLSYGSKTDQPDSLSAPGFSGTEPLKEQEQGKYKAAKHDAGGPVDNSRIFAADRYLIGVLETGINTQISSDDGGRVIIQITDDAFGYHGRNILIPKGSRLLCSYQGPQEQGASRFALECDRLLTAGQRIEIYQIAAPVGDQQGHAGLSGEVDDRFWEKNRTALYLGGLSAFVQGLASLAQNSAGSDSGTTASAAQEAAANLSERFGEITASSLEQTIDLKPIIRLSQGTRVMIRPKDDWYFPKPGEFPALDTAALNGLDN